MQTAYQHRIMFRINNSYFIWKPPFTQIIVRTNDCISSGAVDIDTDVNLSVGTWNSRYYMWATGTNFNVVSMSNVESVEHKAQDKQINYNNLKIILRCNCWERVNMIHFVSYWLSRVIFAFWLWLLNRNALLILFNCSLLALQFVQFLLSHCNL